MDSKLNKLAEQMKKMTVDLEAKKAKSASLISNYEQKIIELQLTNAAISIHSSARNKVLAARKTKTSNAKIALSPT